MTLAKPGRTIYGEFWMTFDTTASTKRAAFTVRPGFCLILSLRPLERRRAIANFTDKWKSSLIRRAGELPHTLRLLYSASSPTGGNELRANTEGLTIRRIIPIVTNLRSLLFILARKMTILLTAIGRFLCVCLSK